MPFTREGRRRKALAEPFPDRWRVLLADAMAHWRMLDDDERSVLEDHIRVFLVDKKWQAARDFELTDEVRVLVSAMASLLILGLDYECYENVTWIEVHPTTVVRTGVRGTGIDNIVSDSPLPILGEAGFDGPVVIAWDAATANARHPEHGHNVVYHEFAHKLDMDDGVVDGTPRLPDPAARQRWIDVCTREYELLSEGRGGALLDPYGATNPGEFFAVATELFFDRPTAMQEHKAELYDVLRDFYRQDPAARERRHRG